MVKPILLHWPTHCQLRASFVVPCSCQPYRLSSDGCFSNQFKIICIERWSVACPLSWSRERWKSTLSISNTPGKNNDEFLISPTRTYSKPVYSNSHSHSRSLAKVEMWALELRNGRVWHRRRCTNNNNNNKFSFSPFIKRETVNANGKLYKIQLARNYCNKLCFIPRRPRSFNRTVMRQVSIRVLWMRKILAFSRTFSDRSETTSIGIARIHLPLPVRGAQVSRCE